MAIHPMLDEYPVHLTLPIQWGDMDAFGHVNNTVHIRWFESARIAYLERIGLTYAKLPGGQGSAVGPILASVSCQYRRQVDFPDTVTIGAKVSRIGNTSFAMHHAVFSEQSQAICAEGDSVIVAFDYQLQQPVRVPEEIRVGIAKLQESFEARE